MKRLTVKAPTPARYPLYRIVSEAGEELALVPITASGDSHKLALVMAAAPDLLAAAIKVVEACNPLPLSARQHEAFAALTNAIAKATAP